MSPIRHARDLPLGSSTVILNRRSPREDLVDLAANVKLYQKQTRADLLLAVLAPLDVPGAPQRNTAACYGRCIRSRVHYRLAALQSPSRSFRHPAVV